MSRLTVIVASQNTPAQLRACLDSLRGQTSPVQLIVADSSADNTAVAITQSYPNIQFIHQPVPAPAAQLHAIALPHADGDVVVFTEAICTFAPEWATAVLKVHDEDETPAIGGAIAPAPDLRPSDLGLFWVDYGRFLPPLNGGPTRDLPGLNLTFKREPLLAAIEQNGINMADLSWKTTVLRRFAVDEQTPQLTPDIHAIYHRRASKGEILRRQWRHGRCFGGRRAVNAPPLRRPLIALFGWFLIPALMKLQFWRDVRPKIQARPDFWLTLPHVVRAILAWSAGEWWGNLFGPGQTC